MESDPPLGRLSVTKWNDNKWHHKIDMKSLDSPILVASNAIPVIESGLSRIISRCSIYKANENHVQGLNSKVYALLPPSSFSPSTHVSTGKTGYEKLEYFSVGSRGTSTRKGVSFRSLRMVQWNATICSNWSMRADDPRSTVSCDVRGYNSQMSFSFFTVWFFLASRLSVQIPHPHLSVCVAAEHCYTVDVYFFNLVDPSPLPPLNWQVPVDRCTLS